MGRVKGKKELLMLVIRLVVARICWRIVVGIRDMLGFLVRRKVRKIMR